MFVAMAVHVNDLRDINTTQTATLGALTNFLCGTAIIFSFADVSGAHFNPAVTFATMVTGKMGVKQGLAYITVQLYSSIMATLALMCVFPDVPEGAFSATGGTGFDIARSVVLKPSTYKIKALIMELILVPNNNHRLLFWYM
jgi:glycerol uptake facilitator-like aquaporin